MWNFLLKLGVLLGLRQNNACSKLGIPKYLSTGSRIKDPIFSDDEKIYRRFTTPGDIDDWKKSKLTGESISASIFPVDDDSVNRGKYSKKPEDVLYNTREQDQGAHYVNHGILYFTVSKFQRLSIKTKEPIRSNNNVVDFTFHLEHKPEACMYPHTEIWILRNGKKADIRSPKSVRALVRDELFEIVDVYKYPPI